MLKVGSNIERKTHRFIIGRFIATIISKILKLKVYDSQCGCKIFSKHLADEVFVDPFVSTWLFDVEIFHRVITHFGREHVDKKMLEVPLKNWIDTEESSVKFTYFFKIWSDLYKINRICRKSERRHKLKTIS